MTAHTLCLIVALACFILGVIAKAVYTREGGPSRVEWMSAGLAFLTLAQLVP
jgi:uncharacterized membrane protein YoaK (UPF0700 family)